MPLVCKAFSLHHFSLKQQGNFVPQSPAESTQYIFLLCISCGHWSHNQAHENIYLRARNVIFEQTYCWSGCVGRALIYKTSKSWIITMWHLILSTPRDFPVGFLELETKSYRKQMQMKLNWAWQSWQTNQLEIRHGPSWPQAQLLLTRHLAAPPNPIDMSSSWPPRWLELCSRREARDWFYSPHEHWAELGVTYIRADEISCCWAYWAAQPYYRLQRCAQKDIANF